MNIVIFQEGSPGHEKQSLAVLNELEKLVDIQARFIKLKRLSSLEKLRSLLHLYFYADGGCRHVLNSPDLLLGTGTQTHLDILATKKKYRIPAVTCMAPDFFLRNRFDLCFVPRHDGLAEADNIFLTDGPPVTTGFSQKIPGSKGLILIGGPNAYSKGWETDHICSYVQAITEKRDSTHWTVSTSPRTPGDTSAALQKIAEASPEVEFFHFRDTPAGWVEKKYEESDITWVTVDSMSMIYEALTAGCKVGLLPLDWKKTDNKFKRSMNELVGKGLAVDFRDWQTDKSLWREGIRFNEAQRCAEEIVRRWSIKS
ncbi:ELM1/GtrOC1 family putative glycosyltransferase [Desulfopila sp. IMCC35008]|uniref:ELM1/GtrOC1 family putative glycosyltransferase n=1 Tax=Desulfopila sp. IMCC35008 TaxID=2653858 RepID=UPI0013D81F5E|nr:ELM1/GtrOC1 family putative glycosyltransferase [Desulfopila sp. IMCC35008]